MDADKPKSRSILKVLKLTQLQFLLHLSSLPPLCLFIFLAIHDHDIELSSHLLPHQHNPLDLSMMNGKMYALFC